jgi:MraZ protein
MTFLTGSFRRSLDEKLRFAMPKQLREALRSNERTPTLYIAPGTDQSLALYTEEAFSQLGQQLGSGSPTAQNVRAFSRMFYAQAQCVEMDRQGRVRIPVELAEMAAITKEIMLLGVRDHVEIWDRQRWESYLDELKPSYDRIAETAFLTQPGSPVITGPNVSATESGVDVRPTQPR